MSICTLAVSASDERRLSKAHPAVERHQPLGRRLWVPTSRLEGQPPSRCSGRIKARTCRLESARRHADSLNPTTPQPRLHPCGPRFRVTLTLLIACVPPACGGPIFGSYENGGPFRY